MTTPLIELRSASFGYADRRVVSAVNLTVSRGEVVALLGPNGSGKSTLVRGLLGLTDQLGGRVLLFGIPREKFTEHTRLGYVPQRHTLSASMQATITEIVSVGRLPHRPWWRPASREDHRLVADAIAAVDLTDRAHDEVASLSGGQQRRVLIARALVAEPDILLMDEPTAGVDHGSQEVFAAVLAGLAERGTSMLIVTHEPEALTGVVTRVVCLEAGRIDFDGTPAGYAVHAATHPAGSHHHAPLGPAPVPPPFGKPPLDPQVEFGVVTP